MTEVRPGTPAWEELPEPRAATPAEQALLTALVASVAELRETVIVQQVGELRVMARCRCGCSSIRLAPTGPAVPPEVVARLSATSRDDYLAVTGSGQASDGAQVTVTLHVLNGRAHELEIFVGEGIAADLPAPDALGDVTLG